jgi:GPH family glycoside/pentoside/hexuronide:cation symporter
LGQALAAGVSGWLLDAIGYRTGQEGVQTGQSPEILRGIYDISTIIPAIGFLALGLILRYWYPLRKNTVAENVAKLAKEKSHSKKGSSL